MVDSSDAQIQAVIVALGLEPYFSADSLFGKAVLSAARDAARNLPKQGDFDALASYALQPGRLTSMAAAVQRATDDPNKKILIADVISPKPNTDNV